MSKTIMDDIIEVVVGALLIGYVGIIGVLAVANATGLSGTVATIFTIVLPILIVVCYIYILVGYVRRSHSN